MDTKNRNHYVKLLSLLFALVLVIGGGFLKNNSEIKNDIKENNKRRLSELNNLYASAETLKTLFEEADLLNGFENKSKVIYGECQQIKTILFRMDPIPANTSAWFSKLSNYALTDMTDGAKNKEYHDTLKNITEVLLVECTKKTPSEELTDLEILLEEKDRSYYRAKLNDIAEQYGLLEKQPTADMRVISDYVKRLLISPTLPQSFRGSYTYPKSLAYLSVNSYADVFPKGNYLGRMGRISDNTRGETQSDPPDDVAYELLYAHAGYTGECKMVFSTNNGSTAYYVFCPVIYENEMQIINYNEPIKLALNCNDNTMTAFDATSYLKYHSPNKLLNSVLNETAPPPASDRFTLEGTRTVLYKNTLYKEYRLKNAEDIYYFLTSDKNNGILRKEDRHFLELGLT